MQSYIFHLSRIGQAEPETLSVTVRNEARARELAAQMLDRAPDHQSIEVWRSGALIFGLPAGDAIA